MISVKKILGPVIDVFSQKRSIIKQGNKVVFTNDGPKLYEIRTKKHFYMAISYHNQGNDFVTFIDRSKNEFYVTLSLADANEWLKQNRENTENNIELPFPANNNSDSDPFNGIKKQKKDKVCKMYIYKSKSIDKIFDVVR